MLPEECALQNCISVELCQSCPEIPVGGLEFSRVQNCPIGRQRGGCKEVWAPVSVLIHHSGTSATASACGHRTA